MIKHTRNLALLVLVAFIAALGCKSHLATDTADAGVLHRMGAGQTGFSNLHKDAPVDLSGYRPTPDDRRVIDNQILALQDLTLQALLTGTHASYYVVDGGSAALVAGDVVCLAGSASSNRNVTKATATPLGAAGRALGIAVQSASPNANVLVAIGGTVSPVITGLAASSKYVRVSSSARAEEVSVLSTGDFQIGNTDAAGNLSLTTQSIVVSSTSGTGVVADLAALRAIGAGSRTDGESITVSSPPSVWVFSLGTGAGFTDDGVTVVKPNDLSNGANGRWYNTAPAPVVPTIAALRLAVSGKQPSVSVQARATLGDDGGGVFDYDSSDTTSSDNGGTIIVAGTRRYKRRIADELNVLWFGGIRNDTGAGSANSTAFAATITAALSAKRSVRVPWGDYTMSAGINLTTTGSQKLLVKGDGKARTRILCGSFDDCIYANTTSDLTVQALSVVGTATGRGFNISGAGSDLGPLHISGVDVSGATGKPSTGSTAGIRILNLNDAWIEDSDVHGNGYANGDGAAGGAPTGDAQIDGYGNGVDILVDEYDTGNNRIHILRNVVTQLHTAYAVLAYDCYRSEAVGNKVYGGNTPGVRAKNRLKPVHTPGLQDDFSGYGIAFYQHVLAPGNNVIAQNYVEETAGIGIYIQANNHNVCTGNILKNVARFQLDNQLPVGAISANYGPNVFGENEIDGSGGDTGVSDGLAQGNPPPSSGYDVAGDNTVISGGRIANCTKHGIRVNGVFKNVSIANVNIVSSGAAAIANFPNGNKLTRLSISNVIIDTPGAAGIFVDSADDCVAQEVTVLNPATQGIAFGGDSGGSTRNKILGCHVKGATADYAYMVRSTYSRVEHSTAPGSTRGILLGTSSSGSDASHSTLLFNDFSDATTDSINVTGTDLQTAGNRTPIGIEGIPARRGGVIYVRGASSANNSQSGALTENGITYATGDRYFAKDQGSPNQNGVFIVNTSGPWQRAPEADSPEDLIPGLTIRVGDEDTVNGGSVWHLVTAGPYVVGTTNLTFTSKAHEIVNNVSTSTALIGETIESNSPATVGAQEYSPVFELGGNGWKTNSTAASQSVKGGMQVRPVQGTANPSGQLAFMFNINGAGYQTEGHIDSDGSMTLGPSGSTFATQGTFRTANGFTIYSKTNGGSDFRVLLSHTDDYIYVPGFRTKNDGTDFLFATDCKARHEAATLAPEFGQADNTSADGRGVTYAGQTSTNTNGAGGPAILVGGAKNGSGLKGGFREGLNKSTSDYLVEGAEVASGRRVLSLLNGNAITTTEMPANTGDKVIYIANASTVPTANPASGGILYVDNGTLKYRGPSGTVTPLASPAVPWDMFAANDNAWKRAAGDVFYP